MKKTKERRPTLRALLARAQDAFARDQAQIKDLEAANRNIAKQRDNLVVQHGDMDRRFRALLWALELAHKENRDLRARLDFLGQTPAHERDQVAIAS